ncbi:hypothetical protein [Carnobacterium maltaromaticum]|uniref:hypothetical protein n=1 Tax=Carnobacterium maltaromaticum TaxID=2751 RepID=UPI00295E4FDA|nr:hypothetical protein [Carnobacterium maltaromaticum]
MKKDKYHLIFIVFFFFLFFISNTLLLNLGETPRSVLINLLSGMAFAPIDVYATVFFLDRFLKKHEEQLEEFREDSDYFSIAEEDQEQLIWKIKNGLLQNFTKLMYTDVNQKFEEIYQERENLLTADFWEKALLTNHLLDSDKEYMLKKNNISNQTLSSLEFSTEIGEYITAEITEFYAIYLKFIPLDIFKELHGIYKLLEVSIIFSDNPYIFETKQKLIEKQKNHLLSKEEYQELADISQRLFEGIYLHLEKISVMTKQHFDSLE